MASTLAAPALALLLAAAALGAVVSAQTATSPRPDDVTAAFHAQYLTVPNATRARESLRYYTSVPHMAGTANAAAVATWTHRTLQSLTGTSLPDANVRVQEVFGIRLSEPVNASVRVTAPAAAQYTCSLAERVVVGDATSDTVWRNRTFLGYAPSGDVTAELVYVNYARASDFDWLLRQGVTLTGKIAIARYGAIFRGLKVLHAQQHGMTGMLIYSDPQQDGVTRGPTYPDGPYRPPSGVQRGSSAFLSLCPGDPNRAPAACGFAMDDVIPRIPVQPLSYADAAPLLRALTNPPGVAAVPDDWRGGLNLTYACGPGPAVVELRTRTHLFDGTLYNVLVTFPGADPDPRVAAQHVIVGNHRDAWVYGAVDPNSGSAVLLEIAAGLGALYDGGWRPKRTLTLASWDGEEFGLLGSTYFGEHLSEQRISPDDVVAYLNLDTAVYGRNLAVQSSPSLRALVQGACANVTDPTTGQPVAYTPSSLAGARLGSGSDYTVFLDALGVSALDLEFGSDEYGVYHSDFDSFYWMTKFGDPSFAYHATMAQLMGLAALRLVDAPVLPFDRAADAHDIAGFFVPESVALANAQIAQGMTQLQDLVWANLTAAAQQLNASASAWQRDVDAYARILHVAGGDITRTSLDPVSVAAMNVRQYQFERQWLRSAGLPGRPFFKNQLIAPGLLTGYAADVLPALNEALRAGNATAAQLAIDSLTELMAGAAAYLDAPLPTTPPTPVDPESVRTGLVIVIVLLCVLVLGGGAVCVWSRYRKLSRGRYDFVDDDGHPVSASAAVVGELPPMHTAASAAGGDAAAAGSAI